TRTQHVERKSRHSERSEESPHFVSVGIEANDYTNLNTGHLSVSGASLQPSPSDSSSPLQAQAVPQQAPMCPAQEYVEQDCPQAGNSSSLSCREQCHP